MQKAVMNPARQFGLFSLHGFGKIPSEEHSAVMI